MLNSKVKQPAGKHIISIIAALLAIFLAVFHVYTGAVGLMYTYTQRGVHLSVLLFIALLYSIRNEKNRTINIANVFMLIATIIPFLYLFINMEYISYRYWGASFSLMDVVTGSLLFLVILIMGKRIIGWTLPVIMMLAVSYGFLGPYLSGVFRHGGYSWRFMLELATWSEMGIFSQPLGVSATYLYLFILFGTLIDKMGTGSTLMDLAKTMAGKQKGGPAKLAVFSSAMMGTISGSPTSNVLTTGAFTIPLMVKLGFEKKYAGAVEAVASTGGMILPPVMGILAFAMVDYSGLPYASIVKSAIIPALLYFLAVFLSVHLHAQKCDLHKFDLNEMPSIRHIMKTRWYTLLPVLILAVPLVLGFTPLLTVSWAIVSLVPISFLNADKANWLTPLQLMDAFQNAAKGAVMVAVPCALAGIIAGVLGVTGVGIRISSVLLELSGGNLLILLTLVAAITMIMGCGLPALLAYVVQIPITIPALVQLGIPLMGAHLFVVYYSTLAFITPPVGAALYAAMAISNATLVQVGKEAVRIALPAFLVPFMFIYSPSLLLLTPFNLHSLLTIVTATLGVIVLAIAVEGFLFSHLSWWSRLLFCGASVLLIIPNNVIGVATIILLILFVVLNYKLFRSGSVFHPAPFSKR